MLTLYSDVLRPLQATEIDGNFADLNRRLATIESRGIQAVSLDTVSWDPAAQTVMFNYRDGRTYGPVPLPQSFFVPRGDWAMGSPYQPRDLVSLAGSLYACRGAHTAAAFNDDLIAGRWQGVALKGRSGVVVRGFYSQATVYIEGDGVLYAPSAGADPVLYRLSYVPAAGLPAGTAPGARDATTGIPFWLPVTTASSRLDIDLAWPGPITRAAALVYRYTAVPYRLGANLPGAVLRLAGPPAAALSLPIAQLRPNPPVSGQPPSWSSVASGTLDWAAGANVGTATTPAFAFQAGDALVVNGPATQDTRASDLQSAILGDMIQ